MRIYQAEKDDRICFNINKDGSSASFVTAQVQMSDIKQYFNGMSITDIIKETGTIQTVEELLGQEQPDLALVVAILVSTGWNLNDDVFTPTEVWKARSSALHKPMNDNHQASNILGHIVKTRVLDKSGNEINAENPPDEFDIEVAGVLYRAFPELSDRIDEIITKANNGEMFVSMECWFPDFGYGFIDPKTGETKIIERTEATAFLTKHLRIYGGCGEYQGYKVGRVLKDIIFGAQGFVDIPANPDSVIKVAANKIAASQVFVIAELNELLEGGVEDVDENQIKELQARLDEALATIETQNKKITNLQARVSVVKDKDDVIVEKDSIIDDLKKSVTEASDQIKAIETTKVELQKQFDEVTQRAEKGEAELEKIRKTEMARDRLSQLSKVKTIDDEKTALSELSEMTDDMFAVVLKYAGKVESKNQDEVDVTKANDDVADADKTDSATAVLDNVQEKDDLDFNVTTDGKESEKKQWLSTAKALCGVKNKKDEGGE